MQARDFCIQVSFIPKGKDTFRRNNTKDVISKGIFTKDFTIGSGKEASIFYKARGIHPLHVKVELKGSNLHVTDLFSPSGVMVNGNKITPGEPFPLRNGECFQLGDSKDLIRLEYFKASTDPRGDANEIVKAAKKEARQIRDEAEVIRKESNGISDRTEALLQEAKEQAENIVTEKTNEMNLAYSSKVQTAINDGQAQARKLLKDAEKEAEELIVNTESKCADLIRKRDEDAKGIIEEAEEKARVALGKIESEAQGIREKAHGEAKEIVSASEVQKQEVLDEKAEVEAQIFNLRENTKSLQKNIDALEEKNQKIEERNQYLIEEEKKFSGKYDEAEQEFFTKKRALEDETDEIQKKRDEVHDQLNTHQKELGETLEKNATAVKNLRSTEEQNKECKDQIEERKELLSQLKKDIEAAELDKVKALEEAENQRKRTSASIIELKKQFERQYEMRKKAEEDRFLKIREREEYAGQERRKMLKKHEKERLPHQVQSIAAAIWNDLAVELQDASFCSDLYESGGAIPDGIEKIVNRSIMEEFDLRTKLSARVPIYMDRKPEPVVAPPLQFKPKKPDPIWKNGAFMAFMGAVLMLVMVFGVNSFGSKKGQKRAVSSQKQTKKLKSVEKSEPLEKAEAPEKAKPLEDAKSLEKLDKPEDVKASAKKSKSSKVPKRLKKPRKKKSKR